MQKNVMRKLYIYLARETFKYNILRHKLQINKKVNTNHRKSALTDLHVNCIIDVVIDCITRLELLLSQFSILICQSIYCILLETMQTSQNMIMVVYYVNLTTQTVLNIIY